MSFSLNRQGNCPSCGAQITFAVATSAAQVCKHCNFVVVRTDRDFRLAGKVADLVAIQSPFAVGVSGMFERRRFFVAGRVQYDRADRPGAPWEEFYLAFEDGSWSWLAHAQGVWYLTSLYASQLHLPTIQQAVPGIQIQFGEAGGFQITERSQRRPISGQGELPFVVVTGQVEYYADMQGPNYQFGTIDYGNGQAPPQVFLGRSIDPSTIQLDSGASVIAQDQTPGVEMQSAACPGCGGNLPIAAPGRSERIICRYCGMASDIKGGGALEGLQPVPMPAVAPKLPLGTKGHIRGRDVIVVGYVERNTSDDEDTYYWYEYLLYAGAKGFVWLLEEEGRWEFIEPVHIGNIARMNPNTCSYNGSNFVLTDTVTATVSAVVGEFYWKVEEGEEARATTYGSAAGKLCEEASGNDETGSSEVFWTLSTPLPNNELTTAFPDLAKLNPALKPLPSLARFHFFWLGIFGLWFVTSMLGCMRAKHDIVFDRTFTISDFKPATTPVGTKVVTPGTKVVTPGKLPGAPADNDMALFSDPFDVPNDRKSFELTVEARDLNGTWMGVDLALVNLETGEVWEDSTDLEYYTGTASGVDEGQAWTENWTEGNKRKSFIYSRLPKGQYVLRIEPSYEKFAPSSLNVHAESDVRPTGTGATSFFILAMLWVIAWIFAAMGRKRDRAKEIEAAAAAARAAQRGGAPQGST